MFAWDGSAQALHPNAQCSHTGAAHHHEPHCNPPLRCCPPPPQNTPLAALGGHPCTAHALRTTFQTRFPLKCCAVL